MLIIGLTGNIGSGKSTVAKMFHRLGAAVIDVDKLAHKLLSPGSLAWKEVVTIFGRRILNADQKINRQRLGRIVFDNQQRLKKLNKVIHPHLVHQVENEVSRLKRNKKEIIIIEAALVIEIEPLFKMIDYLIMIKIDRKNQISRLKKNKKHLTRDEIVKRIKSQMPQQEKIKLADFVINNTGSLQSTQKQVKKIWDEDIKLLRRKSYGYC